MRQEPETVVRGLHARKFPEAKVIFLAGSVVRGEATPESDLDLVVVSESLDAAYRDSFRSEGWPIEAFVHDPETLAYFMEEVDRPAGVPSLADMVAHGIALPVETAFVATLRDAARRHLERGPKPWSREDIDSSRYFITDVLDDLKTPRSREEALAAGTRLYAMVADHFFRRQGRWSAKGKSIPRRLRVVDPGFEREFSRAFQSLFGDGDAAEVIALADRLLDLDGGRLFEGHTLIAPPSWRISPKNPG